MQGLFLAFGFFCSCYGLLLGAGWLWHFVHKYSAPAPAPAPAVVERRIVPAPPIHASLAVVPAVAVPLPAPRVSLPRDSDGTEESEEAEESPKVYRQSSGGYVPRYESSERVRVPAPVVVMTEDDDGEAPVRRGFQSEAQDEDSRRLDDFVGGIDPRRGQTIKTGSTAFREDGDMVIVTGSTIHTSRGMWVDTGGVILAPDGRSMLRVGNMIYENGMIKSQKIGGDDGDYYLRRGYSINQSSQTLTDFDE